MPPKKPPESFSSSSKPLFTVSPHGCLFTSMCDGTEADLEEVMLTDILEEWADDLTHLNA